MSVTREQVYAAIDREIPEDPPVPSEIAAATDAVLDLLADAELDAEGELREQLTARYEQRLAQALAEAPQPKVLTELENEYVRSAAIRITNEMDDADRMRMTGLLMIVDRLLEDTAPPVTEDPEDEDG